MKYIFVLVLIIMFSLSSMSQVEIITLDNSKGQGAIFLEDYNPKFLKYDSAEINAEIFTVSLEEVKIAESLLSLFDPKNQRMRRKSNRQYLGYVKNDKKFLLIHVMRKKSRKQFNEDFPSWEKSFSILLNNPEDPQKSYLYKIDLSENTIGFY